VAERPYNRTLGGMRVLAAWAAVAVPLAFARPTPASLAVGLPLLAAGEALRLWAAGHLRKTVELATTGPYSHTRNPLYLGRLAIFTGLCVTARLPYGLHWLLLATGWAIFFGYYLPRKERVEPARLRESHGECYERYHASVPALFPTMRPRSPADGHRWSAERCLANREHWMLAALLAAVAWLVLRAYSAPSA
jgi:protein-S-isoprenylcysteine O-methyltransferase Ste14